jgi:hypothetical protein
MPRHITDVDYSINKDKSVPKHTHGGAGEGYVYCSYSFTTLAPDRVSGQRHAPTALYPWGKDLPVPIVQEAG